MLTVICWVSDAANGRSFSPWTVSQSASVLPCGAAFRRPVSAWSDLLVTVNVAEAVAGALADPPASLMVVGPLGISKLDMILPLRGGVSRRAGREGDLVGDVCGPFPVDDARDQVGETLGRGRRVDTN